MSAIIPDTPREVADLLVEYDERIRKVLNHNNLRDYLSGDEKSGPFCILTDDRLYVYRDISQASVEVLCANVENVKSVSSISKCKKQNYTVDIISSGVLFVCAMLIFILSPSSKSVLSAYVFAFCVVMFYALGLFILGFAVKWIYDIVSGMKNTRCFQLCIELENGRLVEMPIQSGAGSEEAKSLSAALMSAKSAKITDIPDLYYF